MIPHMFHGRCLEKFESRGYETTLRDKNKSFMILLLEKDVLYTNGTVRSGERDGYLIGSSVPIHLLVNLLFNMFPRLCEMEMHLIETTCPNIIAEEGRSSRLTEKLASMKYPELPPFTFPFFF